MSNITDKNLWQPYDDSKIIEMKARHYMERIRLGASLFERNALNMKPSVFMSMDVFHVLASQLNCTLHNRRPMYWTIYDYKVEFVMGTEQLYIGFDLLGKENVL